MNNGFGENLRPSAARLRRSRPCRGRVGASFSSPLLSTLRARHLALLPGPAVRMPRWWCLPCSTPGSTSRLSQGLPAALVRAKSVFCEPHRESPSPVWDAWLLPGRPGKREQLLQVLNLGRNPGDMHAALYTEKALGLSCPQVRVVSFWHHTLPFAQEQLSWNLE